MPITLHTMKHVWMLMISCLSLSCFTVPAFAQPTKDMLTEASIPSSPPLDDIVQSSLRSKPPLAYSHIREADVLWKKRIWRVIDIREKRNLPFAYPERPFFQILLEAALNGEITAYSTEDDKFSNPLTMEEVAAKTSHTDTTVIIDPVDFSEKLTVVHNEINYEDIKRFRIKEMWYFDEERSQMKVRILGIAPLRDVEDDNGNWKYESPMFWLYYPECRKILAHEQVFNFAGNLAAPTTWDDLFEMRLFSSYIYKESNMNNDRLKDYLSGLDLLLEADKIKSELFDFEHDVWSY